MGDKRRDGMIKKVHHTAVAVKNLDAAIEAYREVLGVDPVIKEYLPHNLRWAIFPVGESEIQLCQNIAEFPSDGSADWPDGSVARRYRDFIRSHGEGVHHMALEVDDVQETLASMTTGRVTIAGQPITDAKPLIEPRARLVFLDQKSLYGLNAELIQLTETH
jgi:catechol 2,3-dioxygenase-like lactoylglutathione lyase family enzyme